MLKTLLSFRGLPVAIALMMTLSACAGAVPWNAQNDAGITTASVKWCETSSGTYDLCHAKIIDGKEKTDVALGVKFPDGAEVTYSAAGVKAFDAHKVRGAVEEAISEDVKQGAPGIVDSVVKAVLGLPGG